MFIYIWRKKLIFDNWINIDLKIQKYHPYIFNVFCFYIKWKCMAKMITRKISGDDGDGNRSDAT